MLSRKLLITIILLTTLSLTACGLTSPTASPTPEAPTPTIAPPTATPEPAAATVNGEEIPVADLNAEVERYLASQSALGKTASPEDAKTRVLDDLIDQVLLAQQARQAGFQVDDTSLASRLSTLAQKAGGQEALNTWIASHGYTDESFKIALRRSIEAAWMRDKIINGVPGTADQVHVQQILLYNQDTAQQVLDQLKAGADFDQLAARNDPATRGELGWFPRGYLLDTKIEDAAFALQPGQYSDIISTDVGFDIIKVVERDPQHPLTPDAYLAMQEKALTDWLQQQRQNSKIVIQP
jgi:peptidyl-prolyl cis-trans isomerase C